ncbi:DUF4190 domain-containing protein [Chengkuizengella sediminis]|uniref:DUF4190 domain-containing protein n=1 Tax=Chengkuizengella sediminis TaxID=1885917 RepID=UPI0013896F2C|nr:DUF4190 domain-containing protein [Chengkuizengella sediminis]NDI33700.1 DUF4190 domain-containing protein [Chengkuizengella sediminis]
MDSENMNIGNRNERNQMNDNLSNDNVEPFDEEYAEEYAPFNVANFNRERNETIQSDVEEARDIGANTTLGIISLVFALASWFIYPLILGPAAAVFGFVAWYQGSRTLGGWSIALGVIAFLAYMVLPLYT